MTKLSELLANGLERVRVERSLSKSALADAAGIPQPTMSLYLNAKVDVRFSTVDSIAEKLGLETWNLLVGDKPVSPEYLALKAKVDVETERLRGMKELAEAIEESNALSKSFVEQIEGRDAVIVKLGQEIDALRAEAALAKKYAALLDFLETNKVNWTVAGPALGIDPDTIKALKTANTGSGKS